MSKSPAVGRRSDCPTSAQLKELFAQIESGRVTKSRLQNFLKPPGSMEASEAISIKVGRFMQQRGFSAASEHGEAWKGLYDWREIGLLKEGSGVKPSKLSELVLRSKARRQFVGLIQFQPMYPRVPLGGNDWLFSVYGREFVELFTQYAEEMSEIFGIKILVHLVQDAPKIEIFDYYGGSYE